MTESRPSLEELMQEGQSLVHALAVKIHRNLPVRVDLDDLVAYGEIGLAEAARDYDASFGAQFTTFAYYRVRGAIYDGLAKMTWTSRARYRRLHYERLANEALAEDAARSTNSASPTLEGEAVWFRNMTETLAVVYLSSQSGDAGGIHESAIADPRALSGPTLVAQREISQKLVELVDSLPHQSRQLVRAIYFDGFTLQQAADRLGISKSWASRLHAKTLEQLAHSLRRLGAAD
jgi:RNA polymerase sigma factor FliA